MMETGNRKAETMRHDCMPTKESSGDSLDDYLDDDELETILIIARNGQSGRITEHEIKLLVAAYRKSTRKAADDEAAGWRGLAH